MECETLLRERRIVFFMGTGGVGKTTLAASAAVHAAHAGRRVALLTIDPAKRLADALGIGDIGHERTPVTLAPDARGTLEAMMLNTARTFDDLVARFARDEDTRQRVQNNPIYRELSRHLAGSSEYAAMEKVHELASSDDFDLVVVDTPPSAHALDFLDAPRRLLWLFESSVVQRLLHPAFAAGRFSVHFFQRGAERVLRLIERVTGLGFLDELSEFLLAFEQMSGAFRQHAEELRERIHGPEASFLVVAAPSPTSAKSADEFWSRLCEAELAPDALLWNRTHPISDTAGAFPDAEFAAAFADEFADKLGATRARDWADTARFATDRYVRCARAEVKATAALSRRASEGGACVRRVPNLTSELHDVAGLRDLGDRWIDAPASQ